MEAKLGRYHVIITVLNLKEQIRLFEIFHCCIQSVRLANIGPSSLILLDTFRTEIRCHHVVDSGQFPLQNVLTSSASDVKYMKYFLPLVAFFQVKLLLHSFAHIFRVYVHQYRLDPVVERVAFIQTTLFSLQGIVVIVECFLVVILLDSVVL